MRGRVQLAADGQRPHGLAEAEFGQVGVDRLVRPGGDDVRLVPDPHAGVVVRRFHEAPPRLQVRCVGVGGEALQVGG